jgi:hypothetical protein
MIQAEGRCDLLEAVTGAKKIRLAFKLDTGYQTQRSYFREVFKKPQLEWGEPAIKQLLKVLEPAIKNHVNRRGRLIFTLVEAADVVAILTDVVVKYETEHHQEQAMNACRMIVKEVQEQYYAKHTVLINFHPDISHCIRPPYMGEAEELHLKVKGGRAPRTTTEFAAYTRVLYARTQLDQQTARELGLSAGDESRDVGTKKINKLPQHHTPRGIAIASQHHT